MQEKDVTIPAIINFLDANIAVVSPEKAGNWIIRLSIMPSIINTVPM